MQHYSGYQIIAAPANVSYWRCGEAHGGALFAAAVARARSAFVIAICAIVAALAAGTPAKAQDYINQTPGVARSLPGYGSPGIVSGDFILKSAVSSGIAYDTNPTREQFNAIPNYIFFVAPSFDLTRDGGNHVENVFVSLLSAKYNKTSENDFTDSTVKLSERYLVSSNSQVLLNASFQDVYQPLVSTNHDIPLAAVAPIHSQMLTGSAGYTHNWGSFDAGANLLASHVTYFDVKTASGSMLDLSYLDANDLSLSTFLNIRLSQHIATSLTFTAVREDARSQIRSSEQWELADKTTVYLTSKTSIGFLVGVSEQDYFNNPLNRVTPLNQYEGFASWSPVRTIAFTARGGYHDLPLNFTTGIVTGGVGRYGSLEFSYEIWKNLGLVSNISYEKMDLNGIGEVDSFSGKAGLTYDLSRYAGLSLIYSMQKLDSSSPVQFQPFNESIVQTSLNLRF